MDNKRRILRFFITGALDEAIWGWAIRGGVVSGGTALWGWLTELSPVAIFVYSLWAFVGVIFLLGGLKHVLRVMPKRGINVEYFEDRPSLYWYRNKIESSRTVWAAYLGGGTMHVSEILNSQNFSRIILLDPNSQVLQAICDMESQQPLSILQDRINSLTQRAKKQQGCEIRWCDDIAYSLLTIGNPPMQDGATPPDNMWVIIETYIAGIEADKRPSIFIEWSENPKMADKALLSFNKLWAHSKNPPAQLTLGKEGSQPE